MADLIEQVPEPKWVGHLTDKIDQAGIVVGHTNDQDRQSVAWQCHNSGGLTTFRELLVADGSR